MPVELFCIEVFFQVLIYYWSQGLCCQFLAQKVLSCASEFTAILSFLFFQVQYTWSYVEVLNPFGIGVCAGWIWIYLYSSTWSHLLKMLPFPQLLFLASWSKLSSLWVCRTCRSLTLFHWPMYLCLPQHYAVLLPYLCNTDWNLGCWYLQQFFYLGFILFVCFAILGVLCFYTKFNVFFSIFMKNCAESLKD